LLWQDPDGAVLEWVATAALARALAGVPPPRAARGGLHWCGLGPCEQALVLGWALAAAADAGAKARFAAALARGFLAERRAPAPALLAALLAVLPPPPPSPLVLSGHAASLTPY
jgi:hypothetical protein